MSVQKLPEHLRRYIVDQDYDRYTPIDQAVWRHIMKNLTAYLATHAHPCYLDGLKKTGIEIDRIPHIAEMSDKLEKFGWRALPVSGFIPPAAFMEIQSCGYLPIASDMRSLEHLMYTPAPDIVHEAAGHAPILVEPNYAAYLKAYATVAGKAIVNSDDLELYEAIRVLSDMKEDPDSTTEQIESAEAHLERVAKGITDVSEAAVLARMNWWTAEYGLIGTLESPKIYGAGLLSSLGEAQACLKSDVKKIPFSLDCIRYSYDITEPQPQLFVTPNFEKLSEVLQELADTMAFRRGGIEGLDKIKRAATVNTVELNSGLQISGRLKNDIRQDSQSVYLQFEGPTQLCHGGRELRNQGIAHHAHGFGSPVGFVQGFSRCLSEASDSELDRIGLKIGAKADLLFTSGVNVKGRVRARLRDSSTNKLLLITFEDCRATLGSQVLFDPSWGTYDMAVGSRITSVFGGPADRIAYGATDEFVAKKIPRKVWSPEMRAKQARYQSVRSLREKLIANGITGVEAGAQLETLRANLDSSSSEDWLLREEINELEAQLRSHA